MPRLLFATLAYGAFVVYGSLLPFDWRTAPAGGAWAAFVGMPWLTLGLGNRIDWLANAILYVPIGFLGTLVLSQGRSARLGAAALTSVLAAALALAVEFAQIFVSPRTVSLNDVVAELAGAAIGCTLAVVAGTAALRLWAAVRVAGPASRGAWLLLYLLIYLALSFFPFDFSSAAAVFEQKLARGHAGWWWAPFQAARPLTGVLKLGLEALLVLPFGLALATAPWRLRMWQALVLGLGLAAMIEALQLFLLSATSQGLSVLSRALGLAAGVALAPRLPALQRALTLERWRMVAALAALPWLGAVAYLAGWGRVGVSPADWPQRAAKVSFLPFFHYYYAGEAQALTSVLQGVASFAGVGLALALALPRSRASHAALAAAAVCAGVETSKLLLAGQEPDPTNVLVAAAAAAAAWALTRHLLAPGTATSAPASVPAATPAAPAARCVGSAAATPDAAPGTAWALATAALLVAAAWAAPGHLFALAIAGTACTACIWRFPTAALLLAPVALALTDVAAWAGNRWLELPDVVTLATLGVALLRPTDSARHTTPPLGAALCLLLLAPGVVLGLRDAEPGDLNALLSPLSPWRSLLLAKGLAAAFVLAWFVRRHVSDAATGMREFGRGMVLALAGVVALTVAERLAFVGPFDFSSDYRAPGPFTAISLGGAYIECFLAAATPFAVVAAFQERRLAVRLCCALLVPAAAYATMVTFSRAGQVVFLGLTALALLLQATAAARPGAGRRLRIAGAAVLTGALALVGGTVLLAPYASTRFAQLDADRRVRADHWQQGLDFSRSGAQALLFGNGLGSFGRESYVQGPVADRPGVFTLADEGGNLTLQAHAGSLSYLDQRVHLTPGEPLTVTARLRSSQLTQLQALLCEKDLVQSRACGIARLGFPADGDWHRVERALTLPVNRQAGFPPRPLRFTLFLGGRGDGRVDVDELSLRDAAGRELLRNGGFDQASAHWLYSSDEHLVWHMKNLWLQVWFEQGLTGVAASAALLLAGLAGAWRGWRGRHPMFLAVGLALLAFQGVGLVDSVIDSPRFLQLYLSLALLAAALGLRQRHAARIPGSAAATRAVAGAS